MYGLKKALIVLVSAACWASMAMMVVVGTFMIVTLRAKSMGASVLIDLICIGAFLSFYLALKKSREAGNTSFGDMFEDLGFRFCVTPFVVMGLILLIMTKMPH